MCYINLKHEVSHDLHFQIGPNLRRLEVEINFLEFSAVEIRDEIGWNEVFDMTRLDPVHPEWVVRHTLCNSQF